MTEDELLRWIDDSDHRYHLNAYRFVLSALHFTQQELGGRRHISGPELLVEISATSSLIWLAWGRSRRPRKTPSKISMKFLTWLKLSVRKNTRRHTESTRRGFRPRCPSMRHPIPQTERTGETVTLTPVRLESASNAVQDIPLPRNRTKNSGNR